MDSRSLTPDDEARLRLVQHHPLHRIANDMCVVRVDNDNLERAIRALKKQTGASGHLRALRGRELFPSRGDRRRAKERAAVARRLKERR